MSSVTLPTSRRFKDLTGRQFGRWTALEYAGRRGHNSLWKVRCVCGTEGLTQAGTLTSGTSASCGCIRVDRLRQRRLKHGMHSTPIYYAWTSMLARCRNPKHPAFKNYGARGIQVTPRWFEFKNFLEDMGIKPEGLTLERRNNNGNYEPQNCYWADRKTQQNNRRNNLLINFQGQTLTASEWANVYPISVARIYYQLKRGKTAEQIFAEYEDAATAA